MIPLLRCAAVAALLLAAPLDPAHAHGGEDHGDHGSAPIAAAPSPAGFGADGSVFQIVLVPGTDGATLVFLADSDSNAPVTGATIDADTGAWQGRATATPADGVYSLPWVPTAEGGDVTLVVSAAGRDDLLLLTGVNNRPAAGAVAVDDVQHWRHWAGGAGIGAALVAAAIILTRRGMAALALATLLAGPALAHEGHDGPEPAAPAPLLGSALTLPKSAQFLLGIRTLKIEPQEAAETIRVVGRVIPDPMGFARVQPSQWSRVVSDPANPLPVPGQAVRRGEVVAVLEPTLSTLERGDKRASITRLDSDISVQERDLARMEALAGITPVKTVETARIRLEQVRRERAQISGISLARELVTSPIDGVITDVHVVPGEVITPDRAIVEIVDPTRLRVEAVIHDIAAAGRIASATASSRLIRDEAIPLRLLGVSPRIDAQDLGVHAVFAVAPEHAARLKIGMPMDVFVATGAVRLRTAVPRDAVTESGGRQVVFVRTAPETFEARPVKVERVVGPLAELAAGAVQPGERVVVQGVEQMRAVR
jgi:membrane fusion protein, heavy metal efflux system